RRARPRHRGDPVRPLPPAHPERGLHHRERQPGGTGRRPLFHLRLPRHPAQAAGGDRLAAATAGIGGTAGWCSRGALILDRGAGGGSMATILRTTTPYGTRGGRRGHVMAARKVKDPELGVLTWNPATSQWEGKLEFPPGNNVRLTLGNEEESDIAKLLEPARRFIAQLKKNDARWRRLAVNDLIDRYTSAEDWLDDDRLIPCENLDDDVMDPDKLLAGLSLHTVEWHG